MEGTFADKILKVFVAVMLAVIVIGGIIVVYPKYRQGQDLRARDQELQAQIRDKKCEIELLKENQRRFKTDPDFVESIARHNRRVYPGELIFIFEDDKK